jgi:hypothetical protein
MDKIFLIALGVLLAAAGIVVATFGFLQLEQIVYVVKLIAGWTAWTVLVAVVYAGCEKLFPNLLCPPATKDS